MKVKIDTKEKFHVITLLEPNLSATMTEELSGTLLPYLKFDIKNVVLNLKELQLIDHAAAEMLVKIQQKFYDTNASFVICELQPEVAAHFEKNKLLGLLNTTPTESEAGDIVQMEEIERELLGGENS
jgi:anti-anti-sigma factor